MPATGTYFVGVSGFGNAAYDPAVAASGTAAVTGDYALDIRLGAAGAAGFDVVPLATADDPQPLLDGLLAANSGITILADTVSFVGRGNQAGRYTGFSFADADAATALALADGVTLSTGKANGFEADGATEDGPSVGVAPPDDPALTAAFGELAGEVDVFDQASLTFQFEAGPTAKSLAFDFVFGSEEFPEFVGSFNDVFGAFLDGKQIALDGAG